MKNMFGVTDIRTKIIEVEGDNVGEVNEFLEEYDGNIIDVQTVGMLYGWCKFVILYKAVEQ